MAAGGHAGYYIFILLFLVFRAINNNTPLYPLSGFYSPAKFCEMPVAERPRGFSGDFRCKTKQTFTSHPSGKRSGLRPCAEIIGSAMPATRDCAARAGAGWITSSQYAPTHTCGFRWTTCGASAQAATTSATLKRVVVVARFLQSTRTDILQGGPKTT